MRSFVDLAATLHGQPLALGPILARVDVGRGREQLYGAQVPELLRVLADSTRVASITASSAIEGVVVEPGRARRLLATGGTEVRRFRNRSERELAGYRDAMDALTRAASPLEPLGVPFLCHLHRLLFGHVEGGGGRLKSDPNMIVAYEGRRRRVIFEPPGPAETPFLLGELCARYEEAATATAAHPLLLVGLAALDLLAIHPFADGNGRVGRMATTHLLLRAGYGVPRYVSVEQRIFDTKAAYYDALEASQRGWRDGDHDPGRGSPTSRACSRTPTTPSRATSRDGTTAPARSRSACAAGCSSTRPRPSRWPTCAERCRASATRRSASSSSSSATPG